MLERLTMTGFTGGGGPETSFLKGFWRFLKPEKDFKFSAFSSYKSGFTLAEVLITLGIIGVVVAMTLPALIADHREKQTVNQVLAFYSKISQATQYIIHEEGEPSVWLQEGYSFAIKSRTLAKKYKKYLKVLTDCGQYRSPICVAPEYASAGNKDKLWTNFSGAEGWRYSMILQDGSSVAFYAEAFFREYSNNKGKKKYAVIYYDTNGSKPPNRFGYDMFQFDLSDDGIYVNEKDFKDNIADGFNDSYWVITHKNLDYQRCPDEIIAGALGCKKKRK